MMKQITKYSIVIVFLAFASIQFIQPEKNNQEWPSGQFFSQGAVSEKNQILLKNEKQIEQLAEWSEELAEELLR